MQQHFQYFKLLPVSAIFSGHHQTMRHFELKKKYTFILIHNGKGCHSVQIDIDGTVKDYEVGETNNV